MDVVLDHITDLHIHTRMDMVHVDMVDMVAMAMVAMVAMAMGMVDIKIV
jgi:hypothetical protein